MSVKIRYILYFRHKIVPFSQSLKGLRSPRFPGFFSQYLSLKGVLYIHDTDAFFIPGRGGVDLGHIKAGGAVKAVVAEVKERGFSDTGLFAGGDVSRGGPSAYWCES